MSSNLIARSIFMTKIFIEEEYGYRHWVWEHPGSKQDVIIDWTSHCAPTNFFDPSIGRYNGIVRKLSVDELRAREAADSYEKYHAWLGENFAGYAHVHMPDDTQLTIDGKSYPVE